ncbi:MAG: MFS transporter [Anaerolineae bacterium]|nr:MFS transporter [Anaerolineae bacterium]
MSVFAVIWLGQTVSQIGSGLTGFALGVWVYQTTGSATQFALIAVCTALPRIVLSPLAGALVDRWDRRWAMIIGDSGAALGTLAIALLFFANQLDVWHIYLATAFSSAFSTLQWPAYAAIVPLLVSKEKLGRANGLMQFGRAASEILAPALAGVLVLAIQIQGVILIDVGTFIFAVTTLLLVRVPCPPTTAQEKSHQGLLWHDIVYGWKYLAARPGLMGLLVFLALVNFFWGMLAVLITPLVLSFTSADALGVIISVAGLGMLAGSLLMTVWGGPKRRIYGVLGFELFSALSFVLMGLRPWAWLIALGAFTAHLAIAIIFACNQALWQSKIAPEVQGRVFAIQQMVAHAMMPLAFLLAGPLADYLFNPLLVSDGVLAGSVGPFIGIGPGRGIALLLVVVGLIKFGVVWGGFLNPHLRLVEDELTDTLPDQQTAAVTI